MDMVSTPALEGEGRHRPPRASTICYVAVTTTTTASTTPGTLRRSTHARPARALLISRRSRRRRHTLGAVTLPVSQPNRPTPGGMRASVCQHAPGLTHRPQRKRKKQEGWDCQAPSSPQQGHEGFSLLTDPLQDACKPVTSTSAHPAPRAGPPQPGPLRNAAPLSTAPRRSRPSRKGSRHGAQAAAAAPPAVGAGANRLSRPCSQWQDGPPSTPSRSPAPMGRSWQHVAK